MGKCMVATIVFLLSFGFVWSGIGPAWAGQVESPGGLSVQAERLKERAERVQQRRKARISQADRQAVADRVKAGRSKGASQTPVQEPGGKEVAK